MCTITVVDDDNDLLQLLGLYLEQLNITVFSTYSNPLDALSSVEWTETDLAIFDIHMPGISGIELSKSVKRRNPDIKIILMSALNDPHHYDLVSSGEINAFVHKADVLAISVLIKELCDG